jgi:hypothetical protein
MSDDEVTDVQEGMSHDSLARNWPVHWNHRKLPNGSMAAAGFLRLGALRAHGSGQVASARWKFNDWAERVLAVVACGVDLRALAIM